MKIDKILSIIQKNFTGEKLCSDSFVLKVSYGRFTVNHKRVYGYRFLINNTFTLTIDDLENFIQRIHRYLNFTNIHIYSKCGAVNWWMPELENQI